MIIRTSGADHAGSMKRPQMQLSPVGCEDNLRCGVVVIKGQAWLTYYLCHVVDCYCSFSREHRK